MAALTTHQHERVITAGALFRQLMGHWWDLQTLKEEWAQEGGLLQTLTQDDLNNAGLGEIPAQDMKDAIYWFKTTVLESIDTTLGEKLNHIGDVTQ